MLYLVLGLIAVHHGGLWLVQRRMLFPGASYGRVAEPTSKELVRLTATHSDGESHAFMKLAKGASAEAPCGVVVYAHGNGEVVADWCFDAEPYTTQGLHFLCVEYRGFSTSDGTPSESGIHSDLDEILEEVLGRPDVDASRLVYHGRSLGGGVLGSYARRRPPSRMILEATFSSVVSMSVKFLAPAYLVRDPLDVRRTLAAGLEIPVLLLHSRVDEVIPFAEFEKNRAAADEEWLETVISESLGHNDSWLYEDPALLAEFAARSLQR